MYIFLAVNKLTQDQIYINLELRELKIELWTFKTSGASYVPFLFVGNIL